MTLQKNGLIRGCWLFALLILAIPLLVRLDVLSSTPFSRLADIVDYIYDDGYYYLSIAANLAETGRSTLDGVTATNGYQPAWMLLLTALGKLAGTDVYRFFISSCVLIYVLAFGSILSALLWRREPHRSVALSVACGLAIMIVEQPVMFLVGLEPILFAPLFVVLVVALERRDVDDGWYWRLSMVLAGFFLVRIDAIVLYVGTCLCLPFFLAVSDSRLLRALPLRAAFKGVLRLSVVVLPTVAAYVIVNRTLFGLPVPVSGLAKAAGGPLFSNWGIIYSYLGHLKSIVLLLAILGVLEVLARRGARQPQPLFYRSLAVVTVAMALHCCYFAALSTWMLWPWYQYLVAFDLALIVARIVYLASLFDLRRLEGVPALFAVLVVGALAANRMILLTLDSLPAQTKYGLTALKFLGVRPTQASGSISQEQANLMMLTEFFEPGRRTVIAMGDRAGGLAYWGRKFVSVEQTEGLTLGVDYYRARLADTGTQYLRQLPIEFMVVDREVIPTAVAADGGRIFVVPDPIQGRVSRGPVPTFCFPDHAIRYQKSYPSWRGNSLRIAFQFADAIPCSDEILSHMRTVETGIGLRQYSLPSEYAPAQGAPSDKRREDHDRHYSGDGSENSWFGRYTGDENSVR